MLNKVIPLLFLSALCLGRSVAAPETPLYAAEFKATKLGALPAGWVDLVNYRPSRNWAVDGNGFLRVMMKEYVGLALDGDRKRRFDYISKYGLNYTAGILVYEGALANGAKATELRNATVEISFKKTSDQNVFFGALLRVKDRDNYYAARLGSGNKLEIIKVSNRQETVLSSLVTRVPMPENSVWKIRFEAKDDLLSAFALDEKGAEQTRTYAQDTEFAAGAVGMTATTFAAASRFAIYNDAAFAPKLTPEQIAAANQPEGEFPYAVVKAVEDQLALNTKFENVADDYDVIVAGGGTGGVGAALQAARLGAKVLLLEETDWIGGQMANAGVTSMDEGGIWGKNPVRERGIYREFHESAVNHYYTIEKDPYTAYHFNLQSEGGFEPRAARGILYGLIQDTRSKATLDLSVRTKVVEVQKTGDAVTGVTLEEWTEAGPKRKNVKCRVVVDATEYGDVIPLTGARYRVGTSTSDNIDPASAVQDHTWLGIIREYPNGLPEELKIKEPPPGYEERVAKLFKNYQLYGSAAWGGENRGMKGPKLWWVYAAWRGMPDSTSPATGEMTEERHTKCGLNGGNDYKVNAGTMENPQQRLQDELNGINLTLSIIYWFQHDLGLPWSVAEDEGYYTPYNLQRMKDRGVRADLLPLAARMPQWPYVREARRIIGVETLRGEDLYTRDRGEEAAKHWASTVAINDYSFDLHGTEDSLEEGLDEKEYINATGPFSVPFGVFIPEKVDGFVPAEKNFSQSRLSNGATRLQPSTMLDGQAAGAIAAMAALKKVQPRQLNIIEVQSTLLANGDTLQSQWYDDVVFGSPLWQATQLLSLYGMMDRPGAMPKTGNLGEGILWGANEKLAPDEVKATLAQLARIIPQKNVIPAESAVRVATRAEFALLAADLLRKHGRYFVTDPSPYAPPHVYDPARKAAPKKSKTEDKGEKDEGVPKDDAAKKEEARAAKRAAKAAEKKGN